MQNGRQADIGRHGAMAWLLLIVAVAAVLRLYRLGVEPLWHDEVFELAQAEDLWGTLLTGANVSSHPPLYALLLKIPEWLGLLGSEWGVRIQSAVLGVLTVPAIYLTTSHLFSRRLGLVSAAVVAVSAFHIVHSQDAKSYILLPLTATLLVYASLRAWEEGGRWWPVYTLLAALAFYSQAFAAPLLVLLNGWYVVDALLRKRPIVPWFVANAAAFLLVLPWIVIMLGKAGDIMIAAEDWWLPRPGLLDLAFAVKTMVFGYSEQKPAFYLVLLACGALSAWGAWTLYREHPRHALLTVLWFAFPVVALFGVSQVANSIFLFRALLPFALPLFVLIAAGLLAIPRAPWRIGAGALLFAATLPSLSDHYFQEYGPHEFPHRPGIHLPIDYDAVAAVILEEWQEGDRIVTTSPVPILPLYFYGIRSEAMHIRSISVSPGHIDYLLRSNPPLMLSNPRFQDYYPVLAPEVLEGAGRIWFVLSDWEQELLRFSAMDTWRWMDARYAEIAHHSWRGIELFLYEARDPPVTVLRDHDDGVRAEVVMADRALGLIERGKILPDDGIVRRPLHQRRGALLLSWDGDDGFVLFNDSGEDVIVDVDIVYSAGMLPIAAWLDDELGQHWAVHPMYHMNPPPPRFELSTAVTMLEPGARATLSGEIPAQHAPLHPASPAWLWWIGPSGDASIARAAVTMEIGGEPAGLEWNAAPPGWRWTPVRMSGDQPLDGAIPISFTVEAVHQEVSSHANFAFLALSRPDFRPAVTTIRAETLAPHEERFVPVPVEAPRTDVWVFEHGEDGRVYRIFRTEH